MVSKGTSLIWVTNPLPQPPVGRQLPHGPRSLGDILGLAGQGHAIAGGPPGALKIHINNQFNIGTGPASSKNRASRRGAGGPEPADPVRPNSEPLWPPNQIERISWRMKLR